MHNMHKNVWLLMVAQALMGSIGPVVVFVGGFVGLKLAPSGNLATLPVACMIVGIALWIQPTVKLMSRIGRKKTFLLASIWGGLNCLLTAYSITIGHFWLFCFSILNFGFMIATNQQFRFAAMESVPTDTASKAISIMLIAGLLAAFIGPEIAFWGQNLFDIEFVGSFMLMAALFVPAFFILTQFKPVIFEQSKVEGEPRPITTIAKQPVFIAAVASATIAFSVMSFIMTATPISMHVHSHFDVAATKWVIQSHIIAMYLPSFFTGLLIAKFGHEKILYSGVLTLFICLMIGFVGQQYVHYWFSLVLLGVGWNFMFVSATALLPSSYEPNERFKVQGINDLIMFTCQAIASLSAGWVIYSFGWNIMLTMCVPLLLLAAWTVFSWKRHSLQQRSI